MSKYFHVRQREVILWAGLGWGLGCLRLIDNRYSPTSWTDRLAHGWKALLSLFEMKAWSVGFTFPVRSINKMRNGGKWGIRKRERGRRTIRRSLLKVKRNSKLITDMESDIAERLIQLFQGTGMKRGWSADFDSIRLPFPRPHPLLGSLTSLSNQIKAFENLAGSTLFGVKSIKTFQEEAPCTVENLWTLESDRWEGRKKGSKADRPKPLFSTSRSTTSEKARWSYFRHGLWVQSPLSYETFRPVKKEEIQAFPPTNEAMTPIFPLYRLNGTGLRVPTLVGSRIEGKGQPDWIRWVWCSREK